MRKLSAAHLKDRQEPLATLPRWIQSDLAAITDRSRSPLGAGLYSQEVAGYFANA